MEIKKEWYKDNLPIKSNDGHAVSVLGQFLKGDSKVIGLMGDYGAGKSSIIKKMEEENREFKFYILSIPNYLDPQKISSSKSYDIKREVRKSISMQLISLFETNSEINIIKKKLYMHTFEKITYKELAAFSVVVLLPIISMNSKYFTKHFKFIKHNQEWLFLLGFVLFAVSIIFTLFKLGTCIKNSKLTDLNINTVGFKQEQPQTYIDYDLETIVALIEINAQKVRNNKYKDVVIVIEDVDRYKTKEVFQEIMHIINACTNTKFIIPMKPNMFVDATEQSKYFDSQYSVLPVNDKINLYEYIEETLNEHECITVDAKVLIQTSPYIEDFRTFHTIYNKYLSLIANYLKVDSDPSKDKRNSIYAIAVLQVFLPNDLKNDGVEYTSISQFFDAVFSKQKLDMKITENYKKDILENEKLIKALKAKNHEIESEIKDLRKLEDDKALKILNYHLCADSSNINDYTSVKVDNSSSYICDVRSNIIRGTVYSLEQLKQIAASLAEYDISLQRFEKFIDDGKQQELLKVKADNNLKQSNLIKSNENLKEKLSKIKNKLENLSSSEIIVEFELNKFVKEKFETYIASDNSNINEYKPLIINLIMNGLFNEDYKKYISILKDEPTAVKLREFKYDVSGELESYVYINDSEIGFNIDQGFIDLFSVYEFSKVKFVRKDIIEFLLNNIEVYENRKKFHKIIDQLCNYLSGNKFFNFNSEEIIHSGKQEQILLLMEYLLVIDEISSDSKRDIDLYLKLMELYFVCNANMNVIWLNNLINSVCEDPETVNVNLDALYPDVLWNYIEYNIDEISEMALLNLMNYFERAKVQSKRDNGIFNNIELVFSSLEKWKLENEDELKEVLVTKNTFVYNHQNIEFLLKDKNLNEKILLERDIEFVKYICNNKFKDVVIDINRLYKLPLIKNSVKNIKALCNTYSFKVLNLNEFEAEVLDVIINDKLYVIDQNTKSYFIDNKMYDVFLENFDLSTNVFTITNEEATNILEYINKALIEETNIDNFINNIDYTYDISNVTNETVISKLVNKNRVNATQANYNYLKDEYPSLVYKYSLKIGAVNLLELGLTSDEYDEILENQFKDKEYNFIDELYKGLDKSNFKKLDKNLSVDTLVKIIHTNDMEFHSVKELRKSLEEEKLNQFSDKLLETDVKLYTEYCIFRKEDLDFVSEYINKTYDNDEKIREIIYMYNEKNITQKEDVLEVLKTLKLYSIFEFQKQGTGKRKKKVITEDLDIELLKKMFDIFKEIGYIKKYDLDEKEIYRK